MLNRLTLPKTNRVILGALLLLAILILSACAERQAAPSAQTGPVAKTPQQAQEPLPENALFICQLTTNQIGVIDLATGEMVRKIPVGAKPIAVLSSPDKAHLYVANSGSGDVYMIKTSTGEIVARMSMGNQPVAMAINKAGDTLYVLDYYLNRVSVLDLKLRSMTGFIPLNTFGFEERIEPPDCCSDIFGDPLGKGRKPSTLVLDESERKIYVGNMGTWDVAIIDLQDEKEVQAFDAAFGINEMFLAGPDNSLYISAAGNDLEVNDFILKMNVKGGGKTDKLKVGAKPAGMALSPDGRIIHIITQNKAGLISLNVADGKIIGSCELEGEPGDIVLSEDGSKAFVADLPGGTVLIIDTKTHSVIRKIEAGVTPKALVYIH